MCLPQVVWTLTVAVGLIQLEPEPEPEPEPLIGCGDAADVEVEVDKEESYESSLCKEKGPSQLWENFGLGNNKASSSAMK